MMLMLLATIDLLCLLLRLLFMQRTFVDQQVQKSEASCKSPWGVRIINPLWHDTSREVTEGSIYIPLYAPFTPSLLFWISYLVMKFEKIEKRREKKKIRFYGYSFLKNPVGPTLLSLFCLWSPCEMDTTQVQYSKTPQDIDNTLGRIVWEGLWYDT